MTIEDAIWWVLGLETPPRPDPSAWTDIAWCEYWRGQRHEVLNVLVEAAAVRAGGVSDSKKE